MDKFSSFFCGEAGELGVADGLPTFCSFELGWVALQVLFCCFLFERFLKVFKMGLSGRRCCWSFSFFLKKLLLVFISLGHFLLLLLLLLLSTTVSLPPVFLWSLALHSVLWAVSLCLLQMEFSRFLPPSGWSVCGFSIAGGLEGLSRLGFCFISKLGFQKGEKCFSFCDFLLRKQNPPKAPHAAAALWLYLATAVLQTLLAVVVYVHPNDLPLELLPFAARLLTHGSATLPFYTSPQPRIRGAPQAPKKPQENACALSSKAANEQQGLLVTGGPFCAAEGPLEVSILSVVLTEMDSPSLVFAQYKIEVRWARELTWVARRRFSEFSELNKHLQNTFKVSLFPEFAAVLPRLPPRGRFCDQQLSLQFLERRRRGLESYLQALAGEKAFWIFEFLEFLETPKELQPQLYRQQQQRLVCMQSSSRRSNSFDDAIEGQWPPCFALRSDASDGATESSSSCFISHIWRLRICKDTKHPFVVLDIRTLTKEGLFFASTRYSSFFILRKSLRKETKEKIPFLPFGILKKKNYFFFQIRKLHLALWLRQVSSSSACRRSSSFLSFLGILEGPQRAEASASLPSFTVSISSFIKRENETWIKIFISKKEEQKETHAEIEVTEKQIQDLHAALCRHFNFKEIKLVPKMPKKGLGLLRASEETLQTNYEWYLREVLQNYPTFQCQELDEFLQIS